MSNNPNHAYSTLAVSDETTTRNRPAFLEATIWATAYDYDGNLFLGGPWNYTYDIANRPLATDTKGAAAWVIVARQQSAYAYDYIGQCESMLGQTARRGYAASSAGGASNSATDHYRSPHFV